MMSVGRVREWLKDIPDDADVAVDDGGLMLVTRMPGEDEEWGCNVLELGGIPLPEDELPDGLEDDDHLIVDHEDDNDRRVKQMVEAPPLNYMWSYADGELDLPFIKLEGLEGSIVGEPVFRLDNERFLVTPNSREWVRNKILEEEETERRCRHLYEACDMGYVERKDEAMRSLKIKLGI